MLETVGWYMPDGSERTFRGGMSYLGVDDVTANEMVTQGLAKIAKPKKGKK